MEELTNMPVSRKNEIQETKKIMAIIGVFFCVHVCIAGAGAGIFASVSFSSKIIQAALVDMLIVLNSCVNVIIYGIFDPKFRQIFLKKFCSCSKTNKNEMHLIQIDSQNVTQKPILTRQELRKSLISPSKNQVNTVTPTICDNQNDLK